MPVANLLGGSAAVPWWSAAVRDWLASGSLIVLVALALGLVLAERVDRSIAWTMALVLKPSPRAFQALVALLVLTLTATFAVYCFARAPFSQDEMAQRFHAQILLSGRLSAAGEPHPEFFSVTGVLDQAGRWYSMYPIGGPALLAAGTAFRAAWLVNPVLTALTACGLYRFTAATFGEGPGRASALLFALSPFVLIMGASEMNHGGALALAMLALAALPAWAGATAPRGRAVMSAAALIGLGVGGMATIRPLDAAIVAVVIGLFQLSVLRREPSRASSLIVQLVSGAVPVAWLLYVNAQTTGHPLVFAYDVLYGPGQRLGFHTDPYGVPFTPLRALALTSANLMRLNRYLFEWPLPGLVPILAALVALRRPTRWDLLLVGLIGATVGAYALYWAADSFFAGPRFLHTALPAFIIFAARAPGLVAESLPTGPARRAAAGYRAGCESARRQRRSPMVVRCGTGLAGQRQPDRACRAGARASPRRPISAQMEDARLSHSVVFVHEPWRARLEARLRAYGLAPGEAARLLSTDDACRIQTALDAEDVQAADDVAARRARLLDAARSAVPVLPVGGLQADAATVLAEGSVLTEACRREIEADAAGTTPYAPFLTLARFERDGSLGGPVVFVRDLGPRNELLRPRFPGRAWFRYRPRSSADDTPAIVPY